MQQITKTREKVHDARRFMIRHHSTKLSLGEQLQFTEKQRASCKLHNVSEKWH